MGAYFGLLRPISRSRKPLVPAYDAARVSARIRIQATWQLLTTTPLRLTFKVPSYAGPIMGPRSIITGSSDTGKRDCEDYAIAKYAALRDAGTPARDLRLLVVRDTTARTNHAVLAARQDGRWLLLDNRWRRLIPDHEARFFKPLFALNTAGVERFTAVRARRQSSDARQARRKGARPDHPGRRTRAHARQRLTPRRPRSTPRNSSSA